jgi:hypothetical protein
MWSHGGGERFTVHMHASTRISGPREHFAHADTFTILLYCFAVSLSVPVESATPISGIESRASTIFVQPLPNHATSFQNKTEYILHTETKRSCSQNQMLRKMSNDVAGAIGYGSPTILLLRCRWATPWGKQLHILTPQWRSARLHPVVKLSSGVEGIQSPTSPYQIVGPRFRTGQVWGLWFLRCLIRGRETTPAPEPVRWAVPVPRGTRGLALWR